MRKSLQEICDKIYCINLDSRPDRWSLVSKEFKKYNILDLVHRVPGETKYSNRRANNTHSHIEIIRNAKQDKLKSVLIFEDDVEFLTKVWNGKEFIQSDPSIYIRNALSQLKDVNWDILFLGWRLPYQDFINYKEVSNNLFQSTLQTTTHAYIINHTIYDKILANNPLDAALNRRGPSLDEFYGYWLSFAATCINIKPLIAGQYTSVSDVKNKLDNTSRWVDKMIKQFYVESNSNNSS